jgi:ABC-type branched-subunit amino acid transport system substrate-binding protein
MRAKPLRKLLAGLTVAMVSAATLVACSKSSESGPSGGGTMTIGVIYPFTGASADQGPIGMAGCLSGAAEVNDGGGVLGKTFVCKSFDTKGDPADAVSAANQMMASANPIMVIGASDDAVTTSPIVTAAHVPNFATIGDPHFDQQTDTYFYRLTPSDALQGVALGYWVSTKNYAKPAAAFTTDLGAQTSVPPLRAEIEKQGGKLVADLTLAPDANSYRTEVSKLIAVHPDVLVSEMDPQSSTTFLSEYLQLAGNLPIVLGTQRTSNSDWIQAVLGGIGQANFTKSITSITPYVDLSGPGYELYKKWLLTLGGQVDKPEQYVGHPYAISDYDAVNITALAMNMANSTDPTKYNAFITKVTAASTGATVVNGYADGLAALKAGKQIQYVGASGPLVFDQYHSAGRAFSYDVYDPTTKSMISKTIIPGTALLGG